jgi:L-sorbose 1-phosphate reductase
MSKLPDQITAIQLSGPGQLEIVRDKPLSEPSEHQILCKVLVVGLCFSDMKLLAQFSKHVRKSEVISGVDPDILAGLPSYVPGEAPTVPGHETVVEISAVGDAVTKYKPGDRYVVQADWRWLKTRESNGAFGYNFEGGLQEYVLADERLLESPEGESMFMPIDRDDISLSAFALVEPWACVEESYQSHERQSPLAGGRLLIVRAADAALDEDALAACCADAGETVRIDLDGTDDAGIAALADESFDDIIYAGANAERLESLFPKAAKQCLINIVACGQSFGRDVSLPLGDIHYRGIRVFGTPSSDPAQGYAVLPAITEIRAGDRIHIVGAGGPMGVMHVMRNLCQGVADIEVLAADLSADRLEALAKLARPAAAANGVRYADYSPKLEEPEGQFSYSVIMAPVPALCAEAVAKSSPGAIINIFAGIPAGKTGAIDLDKYIRAGLYFFGTSGSVMEDMRIVKSKVEARSLDTNVSVAAICGLDGAIDGLRAVETQAIPGKILVYPDCRGMGLITLAELEASRPAVHAKLADGVWSKAAEDELLGV